MTAVFVTINQQGQRLTAFDLMVAKSWIDPNTAPPGFDLREKWNVATGRDPRFPASHAEIGNFDLDEVLPLRLVKLLTGLAGSVSNAEIINSVTGADVRTHFVGALDALEGTLKLLRDAGSVVPECLPSETGILPIAYVIAQDASALTDAGRREKLLRWFWASTFLQRYGRGGTNTLAVGDARDLEGWVLGQEQVQPWITNFWTDFTPVDLLEAQPTNEVLLRGILSLQNHLGAIDWITGDPIRTLGRAPAPGGTDPVSRLEWHHVFPEDNPLPGAGGALPSGEDIPVEHDLVINRAMVLKSTNRTLGATPASQADARGADFAHVESHLIDRGTLGAWDDFVADRIDEIRDGVRQLLP